MNMLRHFNALLCSETIWSTLLVHRSQLSRLSRFRSPNQLIVNCRITAPYDQPLHTDHLPLPAAYVCRRNKVIKRCVLGGGSKGKCKQNMAKSVKRPSFSFSSRVCKVHNIFLTKEHTPLHTHLHMTYTQTHSQD